MKSVNVVGVVLLLFTISSTGLAAPEAEETPLISVSHSLSPDDLYEIALRNNPDHQKNLQNASLAGSNMRSALGTLLPSVDVGFSISQNDFYNPTYIESDGSVSQYPLEVEEYVMMEYVESSTGVKWLALNPDSTVTRTISIPDDETRSSRGWISIQETINLGGQQYFNIKNAKISNRIDNLAVNSSELNLYFSVRQNYYNVLAYRRFLDLAHRVLEQRTEQLRLAQARYDVGSVTELDVLQAEIDVGNQENAVIEAENNVKMAVEALNAIIGVDLDSEYELVDEFNLFSPEYDLGELTREAVISRPDYLQYVEMERYNKNSVNIQRGQFLPNLTASLSHTRSENSGTNVAFTTNPRNRNTSLGLTLSWNLFSGFSDASNYQTSRVALNNARHDRKQQELTIEQEVRQAYYQLMQTYEQSRVTAKNRELASRQLVLEQERYRLGATSQLNLRTAQVTFEQAEADHIANIFNFWSALAALENAVGKRLQ